MTGRVGGLEMEWLGWCCCGFEMVVSYFVYMPIKVHRRNIFMYH